MRKARIWRAFLIERKSENTNAWLGEEFEPRYGELELNALACPRGAAESLFVKIHRPFKTLEFREPYRIRGVQSFGDKWVFRRIMSAPCREGVRISNEKSLPLLGLIAHKLTRRICGFGQGGGGRGAGIRTFSAWHVAVKGAHVRNSRGAADRRDLANAVGLVEKVSAVPKALSLRTDQSRR